MGWGAPILRVSAPAGIATAAATTAAITANKTLRIHTSSVGDDGFMAGGLKGCLAVRVKVSFQLRRLKGGWKSLLEKNEA
jgi:uncharacterized protein (DUF2345 family)